MAPANTINRLAQCSTGSCTYLIGIGAEHIAPAPQRNDSWHTKTQALPIALTPKTISLHCLKWVWAYYQKSLYITGMLTYTKYTTIHPFLVVDYNSKVKVLPE